MVIFGEFQSDFCENLTEFYQISLKNHSVHGMYETSIKNIEIFHVANVSFILSTKGITKVLARLR